MFRNILMATDLTEASQPALHTALELAARLGARLTVLHVTEPPYDTRSWVFPLEAKERDFFEHIEQRERQAAERFLADLVKKGSAEPRPGAPVKTLVKSGIAADVILDSARTLEADLIVMGTHGRTGFAHALLGSIAERMLRTAPCPVLTIRARQAG